MYNNTPGPTGNGQWNPANKQQSPPGALEQSPQWPYANNPPPDQQILLGPFDASSPWPYANNQQGQQVPQDNTQWPYASNGQMPPTYDNSYPRTPSRLLPGIQGQQAPQDNGLQWPYANNQQGQQAYANNGQGQQPYDNYARNGSRGLLSGSNQQVYNPAAQPTLMPGQFVYDPPISSGRGLAPSRHSKGWFNDQNRQTRTIVTGGIIIFLLLIGFGAAAIYGNHPQAPTVPPVSTLTTAPTIIPTATTLPTPTPTTAPSPTAQPTQPPPTPTPRSIPTTVPTQRPVATATPVALPTMTATPVKVPTATPPGKTPIVSGTPGHP